MLFEKIEICLVDDEPELVEAFSELLSTDYNVRAFTSAEAALNAMDLGMRPDVLVTDLKMPGTNGFEFVERMKLKNSNTAIVMVSGHAQKGDIVHAMKNGVHNFLEKPFSISQLREVVEEAVSIQRVPRKTELSTVEVLEQIAQVLHEMNRVYYCRAALAESHILQKTKALYSEPAESLQFFQLQREERLLRERMATLKNIVKIGAV